MERKKSPLERLIITVPKLTSEYHLGAYAAQAAYFFVLSLIPIILLLLTMVQFTPLTKADVMTAVIQIFPSSVNTMITSIVNSVYNQSVGIIPLTLLVTLWSAGKGVLALTTGFNCINDCLETRNYVFLRIRATLYTLLFIVVIVFLLVLSVFGNSLNNFILRYLPFASTASDWITNARLIFLPILLMFFLYIVYLFLPNKRMRILGQFLGAIVGTIGCMFISFLFSVYLQIFKGFASLYGSLTTIVLIMLWMYLCMYAILLGSLLNRQIEISSLEKKKSREKVDVDACEEEDDTDESS